MMWKYKALEIDRNERNIYLLTICMTDYVVQVFSLSYFLKLKYNQRPTLGRKVLVEVSRCKRHIANKANRNEGVKTVKSLSS